MARTYQKKTSRSERARDFRRPVLLPEHRKGSSRKTLVSRILRTIGVFLLCVLVEGWRSRLAGTWGL